MAPASSRQTVPPFQNGKVAAVFAGYPETLAKKLAVLRRLIFETAGSTAGVGALEETLKWGQPSYLTPRTKSGTTIRIDAHNLEAGEYAMYVHCQTDLVARYRRRFSKELSFEGDRAIIFNANEILPESAVRECIQLALTYHLRKKKK